MPSCDLLRLAFVSQGLRTDCGWLNAPPAGAGPSERAPFQKLSGSCHMRGTDLQHDSAYQTIGQRCLMKSPAGRCIQPHLQPAASASSSLPRRGFPNDEKRTDHSLMLRTELRCFAPILPSRCREEPYFKTSIIEFSHHR
jgi:hypothetical protein